MARIEQLAAYGNVHCAFAGQCLRSESVCHQTTVDVDPGVHEKAKELGLKPAIVDDSYIGVGGNKLGELVSRITICPAAAHNSEFIAGLRALLSDEAPEVYEDDPDNIRALQEVQAVIASVIDPDDVSTELGLAALEKITGGELERVYPVGYRLTDTKGFLERINLYELEEKGASTDGR